MSKWIKVAETPPPADTTVLVSDGEYVGLAQMRFGNYPSGRMFLTWDVPGVSGYEWDLDEPTHWQPIELPEPPTGDTA